VIRDGAVFMNEERRKFKFDGGCEKGVVREEGIVFGW
jgi:hypothetical protein